MSYQYTKISGDELSEEMEKRTPLPFTDEEIESLKRMLKMSDFNYNGKLDPWGRIRVKIDDYPESVIIEKTSDSWYYLSWYSISREILVTKFKYFKCDEFDGLIECIKNETNMS